MVRKNKIYVKKKSTSSAKDMQTFIEKFEPSKFTLLKRYRNSWYKNTNSNIPNAKEIIETETKA